MVRVADRRRIQQAHPPDRRRRFPHLAPPRRARHAPGRTRAGRRSLMESVDREMRCLKPDLKPRGRKKPSLRFALGLPAAHDGQEAHSLPFDTRADLPMTCARNARPHPIQRVNPMLCSIVCRHEHLASDWHMRWAPKLAGFDPTTFNPAFSYRKCWEWAAIMEALRERDMLRDGRLGLGFAVGTEPLPSAIAAHGVRVMATDLHADRVVDGWAETGQHAASLDALFRPDLIDRAAFDRLVTFQPADMRVLDGLPEGEFDFLWSSCSLEHLGTLEAGMDYVRRSTAFLKPGGVAVHTTEFNCSSLDATVSEGQSVVYRRRDIERLDASLRSQRCGLARPDFYAGDHPADLDYDVPPFMTTGRMHLKLEIDSYVSTSILLIVQKA